MVGSNTGKSLIYAGAGPDGNGFFFGGFNKTGESVVELYADDYGNGVVGAYNRKGETGCWNQEGEYRDTTGAFEAYLINKPI